MPAGTARCHRRPGPRLGQQLRTGTGTGAHRGQTAAHSGSGFPARSPGGSPHRVPDARWPAAPVTGHVGPCSTRYSRRSVSSATALPRRRRHVPECQHMPRHSAWRPARGWHRGKPGCRHGFSGAGRHGAGGTWPHGFRTWLSAAGHARARRTRSAHRAAGQMTLQTPCHNLQPHARPRRTRPQWPATRLTACHLDCGSLRITTELPASRTPGCPYQLAPPAAKCRLRPRTARRDARPTCADTRTSRHGRGTSGAYRTVHADRFDLYSMQARSGAYGSHPDSAIRRLAPAVSTGPKSTLRDGHRAGFRAVTGQLRQAPCSRTCCRAEGYGLGRVQHR